MPDDELVVAADDREALVVAGKRVKRGARVAGQEHDQVERRLVVRVAAVLGDGVGHHQLAEAAARADRVLSSHSGTDMRSSRAVAGRGLHLAWRRPRNAGKPTSCQSAFASAYV